MRKIDGLVVDEAVSNILREALSAGRKRPHFRLEGEDSQARATSDRLAQRDQNRAPYRFTESPTASIELQESYADNVNELRRFFRKSTVANTTFFYHSFPRPRHGESSQQLVDRGFATLRSIQRNGLILAPEVVEWTAPVSLGSPSPHRVLQQRVCFTELRPDELAAHSRHFGPYAIEFGIAALRRAGAMPVIYMPQALSKDDHFALLGPFVVSHLGHIKHMLQSLDDLKQSTDLSKIRERYPEARYIADDCVVTLSNGDEQRGIVQEFEVPIASVRDMLSFIGFENAPFSAMLGALSIVQSLFYPTDNDRLDEPTLAYYRQREWRITADYSVNGQPRGASLPPSERQRLLQADRHFWKREIQLEDQRFRRVDKAVSLALPPPEEVRSMITRVLVPSQRVKQAKRLFPGVPVEVHP